MGLSKVLESIYVDKPLQGAVDSNQSTQATSVVPGIEQSSSIGKSPEDYDKNSNVPVNPLEDNLESTEDCDECPKVTLAHSLIQWIKDNAETIHSVLDAVESGEYDDSDFDDSDSDDEYSNQSPSEAEPIVKTKEFEEKSSFDGFGFDDDTTPQTGTEWDLNTDTEQSPLNGDEPVTDLEPDDPDRQGDIRTVQDAHLVFKRKTANGTFEELWFYNVGSDASRSDDDIKRDILSGTSIDPKKLSSEDGKQQYTMVTMGNGQMIHIMGVES